MRVSAFQTDPTTYVAHQLHRGERDWSETNCYVDVWIELLNALGREPLAGLGFTIAIDWESDQWTFFKCPAHDLRLLYGLTVFEINPWVSVLEQTISELRAGRPMLIEVDSWFLPDTAGTAYQTAHVKTTIGALSLDTVTRSLHYVHNQSMYELNGEDFEGLFRTDTHTYEGHLPPYVESVRTRNEGLTGAALAEAAVGLLGRHLHDAPRSNPFVRFVEQMPNDLATRCAGNAEMFHQYCFATFRQFGAAFSLAASHLDWLVAQGGFEGHFRPATASGTATASGIEANIQKATESFRIISATAKTLQMKAARTAIAGKPFTAHDQTERLVTAWDDAIGSLRAVF